MKVAVTILIALVTFGFFTLVQGEEQPQAVVPTQTPGPQAENPPNLNPAQLQELLKLREKVGSRLTGDLLEDDPQATQNDFEEALKQISKDSIDTNATVAPARFNKPALPSMDSFVTDTQNAPGRLPAILRYTSLALDQRAGLLELQRDFENAEKLRRQASKLRKQASFVESLEQSATSDANVSELK